VQRDICTVRPGNKGLYQITIASHETTPNYIYIITNPNKTVLYIGVTNNVARRVTEHYVNRGQKQTFAGDTIALPLRLLCESLGALRG